MIDGPPDIPPYSSTHAFPGGQASLLVSLNSMNEGIAMFRLLIAFVSLCIMVSSSANADIGIFGYVKPYGPIIKLEGRVSQDKSDRGIVLTHDIPRDLRPSVLNRLKRFTGYIPNKPSGYVTYSYADDAAYKRMSNLNKKCRLTLHSYDMIFTARVADVYYGGKLFYKTLALIGSDQKYKYKDVARKCDIYK
jgi:hypothetical protein